MALGDYIPSRTQAPGRPAPPEPIATLPVKPPPGDDFYRRTMDELATWRYRALTAERDADNLAYWLQEVYDAGGFAQIKDGQWNFLEDAVHDSLYSHKTSVRKRNP